jgi:hypothetical protein
LKFLLDAKTSTITLGDIWTFIENVADRHPLVPGVTADNINDATSGSFLEVQLYVAPSEVQIERQGEMVTYPAGFQFQMKANMFGMELEVGAYLMSPESLDNRQDFWDFRMSFAVRLGRPLDSVPIIRWGRCIILLCAASSRTSMWPSSCCQFSASPLSLSV